MIRLYVLIDPVTLAIRYVGQTINTLKFRVRGHCNNCKGRTHVQRWVNSLLQSGLRPIIHEIDFVPNEFADDGERFYIEKYRDLGCPLTNSCGGGRVNRLVSEETRAKQSAAKVGRPLSNEHKRKLSEAGRGRLHTSESRAKRAASLKGHAVSDKTRQAVSHAQLDRKHSAEHIKKFREAMQGRAPSEETMRAASEASRSRVWSQASRDKLGQSRAKTYRFLSPNDIVYDVTNLRKFCRDHDLNNGAMSQVANGRKPQYKGWRLPLSAP